MEPPEAIEIDAVSALLDSLDDASGHEVMVYELTPEGRQMLARSGAADFDVWDFAEKFGGGEYELRLRDVRTKQLGTSRRFRVSKRVPRRDVLPAAAPAPQPAPASAGDRTIDLMLAMMKQSADQAARASEQTTNLLTAIVSRPQPDNFGQVIQAATLLAGKQPAATPLGELIEALPKLRELAGGPAAEAEGDWLKSLAPVVGEFLRSRPQPSPQPQRSPMLPQITSIGGAGVGALAPASPTSQTTPAQATAADTPTHTNDRPAVPAPLPDDDRGHGATAAIETIAAIALRLGLQTGGAIDAETTARIARQSWAALDLDNLGDMLAIVPPGELAGRIIQATPELLREQMSAHTDALRRVEQYLRDTHEAAQTDDDQEDSTDARQPDQVSA